jgi:energy-coupling factor transporter ATP-binding protein EcfA2
MSNQLKISTLRVTNFGGLKNLTREFPSENLITIFGSNEAGKSTLAEAIMWLIAGPTTNRNRIRSFGNPTDILIAELVGLLGESELRLQSEFRVLKDSISTNSPFTAELDRDSSLSREAWMLKLGDPSTESIHAVHRIDGAEGHQINQGETVLELASKGMFGGVDPRSVTKTLKTLAQRSSTSIAAGERSVKNIRLEIDTENAALKEAGKNAGEYLAAQEQLAQAQLDQTQVARSRSELASELTALRSAQRAHQINFRKVRLIDQVSKLEQVSPSWATMADALPELQRLLEFDITQQPKLTEQIKQAHEAADPLNESVEHLASLGLTDINLLDLSAAVAALTNSQSARKNCLGEVAEANGAIPEATQAQERALAALGPSAHEEAVLAADLGEDSRTRIQLCLASEDQLRHAVIAAVDETKDAAGKVDVAAADHHRAVKHWDEFGTGSTAETWLAGGQTRQAQPGSPSTSGGYLKFVPSAILGVLALAGFLLSQPALGILAAAGLVITVVLAMRGQTDLAATPQSPPADYSKVNEAANQVNSSATLLNQQISTLAEREINQKKAEQKHSDMLKALQVALTDAALPNVINPAEVSSLLRNYQVAQSAIDSCSVAQQRCVLAQERADLAAAQIDKAEAVIREQLTSLRLPMQLPLNSAIDQFAAFRVASDLAKQAVQARGSLQDHNSASQTLCEAVVQPGQVIDLADIAKRAELSKKLLGERDELIQQIQIEEAALQDQIAGSERVDALLQKYENVDELSHRQSEVDALHAQADTEFNDTNAQLGRIQQRLDDLAKEGEILTLNESLTALNEEQSEAAVQAAIYAVAATILADQADLADQQNQPKLIERTSQLAVSVAQSWAGVRAVRDSEDGAAQGTNRVKLMIDLVEGGFLPAHQLSTGARAVLYLALRLAVADDQSGRTGVWLPLICDDPLVHLDEERAAQAMALLAEAAENRQVILLTCNKRSRALAQEAGAQTLSLSD